MFDEQSYVLSQVTEEERRRIQFEAENFSLKTAEEEESNGKKPFDPINDSINDWSTLSDFHICLDEAKEE